jgi:hypothetical protein
VLRTSFDILAGGPCRISAPTAHVMTRAFCALGSWPAFLHHARQPCTHHPSPSIRSKLAPFI